MTKVEHNGRPVPWIVRWTSEVLTPGPRLIRKPRHMSINGQVGTFDWQVAFNDETPDDRIDGQLWLRENNSQGVGEPMYADVHSHRQRRCQLEGLCQVCGETIEPPLTWLIPPRLARKEANTLITDVAPICDDCLSVSRRVCPTLHRLEDRLLAVSVFDYRPYALFGDTLREVRKRTVHSQGEIPLSGPVHQLVARQLVVQLWNFRRRRL